MRGTVSCTQGSYKVPVGISCGRDREAIAMVAISGVQRSLDLKADNLTRQKIGSTTLNTDL